MKKLKHFLATPVKNGYSPVCTDKPTSKVVLGLGALTGTGLDLSQVKWVPESNTQADKFPIESGDFLVSRSNTLDKVGRAALYRGGLSNCSYPDLMMKFRVDEEKIIPDFMELILQSAPARKHFMRCASGTSSTMAKITKSVVESLRVPEFSMQQQQSIVKIAREWDNAIEKTEALIAAKEKQFEWLKSQLLLNNPKSKRWNTSTLGEFIVEKKEKSTTPDLYPCLTSSRRGIFLQEDYFSKQVASKDNSGYKIMSRGDFTFRSMSDDGLFVFNKQTIIDKGLISPAYGVFSPKQNMDSDFLYYFLNSPAFRRALSREVQGGTRTALKLNALKKLEVKIPCIQEQKDIASKLNIAKKEIDLVKELLEKYRSQKRGLMQKLLTGEWQVTSAEGELQDRTKENVA
ncbi:MULTISPECIES: restriction endonuclease subunit S [Pseudoalteromonas]|uniref:restriction endonuclease subunit S n=1 Tax=Pseudoalteromonas TaxID=53246 RepID=UPI0009F26715|nr:MULTISPECIES: restriction endonuclease subunit S [Pseudoalteromonas]